MFSIAGTELPTTPDALLAGLRAGTEKMGVVLADVRIEGNSLEHLQDLFVNFSGTQLSRTTRLPSAKGDVLSQIHASHCRILADPVRFETLPVNINFEGNDTIFAISRDLENQLVFSCSSLKRGQLLIESPVAEIERYLQQLVADLASKQGAEVRKTEISLHAASERSLDFRATVTAKAFVMSTTLTLTGRLEIDDRLQLNFSKMSCGGDGMIASMAAGVLRPRLEQLEQRPLAIGEYLPQGIVIRSATLETGEKLRIRAEFGV